MSAKSRPIKFRMFPEKRSNAFEFVTICEVHRRAWRLVEDKVAPVDPETADKLKADLEEAYDLGKRMFRGLARARGTGLAADDEDHDIMCE